ncbi:MAG TPA: hypothetical protein VGD64_09055 [Acidisarcina sp.]
MAEVVDHFYVLEKEENRVKISFLTSRTACLFPIFIVAALGFAILEIILRLRMDKTLLLFLCSGWVSVFASTCFALAPHLTRYVITIEPDVVLLQREFQGIPVGRKKIHSRLLVSDLGIYPRENRGRSTSPPRLCQLCFWTKGMSVEIESSFPISEAVSLARDLRTLGIEFPRTYPIYDGGSSYSVLRGVYLSL